MVEPDRPGRPVGAYYHWTLADNYEWGSYQPRFGLFGVDRERGTRILDTDAHGDDSAGAYRRIIEGLRAGDRSVLRREHLLFGSMVTPACRPTHTRMSRATGGSIR